MNCCGHAKPHFESHFLGCLIGANQNLSTAIYMQQPSDFQNAQTNYPNFTHDTDIRDPSIVLKSTEALTK
jgi:hypothetical protein